MACSRNGSGNAATTATQQSPGQQPPGQQPPGQEPPGQEPPGQQPPLAPPPPPKKGVNVIAWILDLGVGAPSGAGGQAYSAYQKLVQDGRGGCDDAKKLADGAEGTARELLVAAAQACLAAFDNKGELWQAAADVRDKNAGKNSLNCLEVSTFGFLDQLVNAHEEHPDQTFQVGSGGANGGSPCPGIKSISKNHGNAGDELAIELINPKQVFAVEVRTYSNELDYELLGGPYKPDGNKLTINEMPDSQGKKNVCVVLLAQPEVWNWIVASKEFTYDSSTASDDFGCP